MFQDLAGFRTEKHACDHGLIEHEAAMLDNRSLIPPSGA